MKSCPTCKAIHPTHFTVCPKDGAVLRGVTELSEGAILRGKYQVLAKLGQGGMGFVYKVRHLHFNEVYALKVISAHVTEEPNFLQRFRGEAQVMRRLRHPNAVQVLDFDETEEGRPFMVMEYVEGKSLDEYLALAPSAPLTPRRALRIAAQVCGALEAAHELGIIHRDIKPSNIILTPTPDGNELARVLDFGVAKVKESSTVLCTASLTGTGLVVGTPAYMAPEQAGGAPGEELDGRADLYSLGVVLYEMLTGQLPFQAKTPVMMLLAHVQTQPRDPRTVRALPDPVANLVLRCLEKDPAQRFASAEALRDALEAIEPDLTVRLTPPPAPSRRLEISPPPLPTAMAAPSSRRTWFYAGVGGLAVLALVIGLLLSRSGSPPPRPGEEVPASATQSPPKESPGAASSETSSPAGPSAKTPSTTTSSPASTGPKPSTPARKKQAEGEKPEVLKLVQSANRALRAGDTEKAVTLLDAAQSLDPNSPAVKGALRRTQRQIAAAQAQREKLKQEEIQQLMQEARQAMDGGRYEEAMRSFEAVLKLDPNHSLALRGLERARRAKEAEEALLDQP